MSAEDVCREDGEPCPGGKAVADLEEEESDFRGVVEDVPRRKGLWSSYSGREQCVKTLDREACVA